MAAGHNDTLSKRRKNKQYSLRNMMTPAGSIDMG